MKPFLKAKYNRRILQGYGENELLDYLWGDCRRTPRQVLTVEITPGDFDLPQVKEQCSNQPSGYDQLKMV